MRLSNRAKNTTVSPLRSISAPKDIGVYHLNIGQPDVESPQEFLDAVKNFSSSVVSYEDAPGNKSLVSEWIKKLNKDYTLDLEPKNFLITSGSSEGLTFLFGICCDAGDEMLVPQPCYANYTGFASMTDVKLVSIDCKHDGGFHLPETASIEALITEKTRAVLLCNPNNPTGTLFTRKEVASLIELCDKHDLFLIVDEVYREFVYDGEVPYCAFQLSPKNKRIVVVDSLSKRYSLCGARIGCLFSYNEELMQAARSFASTRVSSPSIEQYAASEMLSNLSDDYLKRAVTEYEKRRNVVALGLSNIEGAEFVWPKGGFYFLVKLPVDDSTNFVRYTLQKFSHNNQTVFVAPASGFFIDSGEANRYVRIAFVLSCEKLARAIGILRQAVFSYNRKV